MAWNSTYQSRAGLFTLTFFSPSKPNTLYDYTFNAAVSFSQERNFADTLNKFSLDIVDDGSKDFAGLENIVLSGITSIRFTYGVGTDNMVSWSGFVYDYTSAFFGQKVKLTLIGYVTLAHSTSNDYVGHYYRLDWSPMIPYRVNFKQGWDLFQTSNYVYQRDGSTQEVTKITEERFLSKYQSDFDKALKQAAKDMNNGGVSKDNKWWEVWNHIGNFLGNIGDGFKDEEDWEDLIMKYLEDKDKGNTSAYAWIYDMKFFMDSWGGSAEYYWDLLQKAKERYQLYVSLYDSYFSKYKAGSFSTNFDVEKLNNAVFSRFPNIGGEFTSSRQILMPVPDLFIQWDGILPKVDWIDGEWKIVTDSLLGTLNDVTAFGLKLEPLSNKKNHDITPTVSLAMSGKDKYRDGDDNVRVLKMNNATFICVSDAKSLAEKRWGKFTGDSDFTEAVSSSSSTSTTSKATLSATANTVFNYFKSRGYSEAAIAAILGNLQCESGLVVNKKEGGALCTFEEACASYRESGSAFGWGLMQWTPPTKIEYDPNGSFYKKVAGDRNTVETQCILIERALNSDYNDPSYMSSWYKNKANEWNSEHPNDPITFSYPEDQFVSKADFKSCTDIQKASRAFHLCVERPAVQNATVEKQQMRAKSCSSFLNAIQGFELSSEAVKIGNTVVPKTWYRSYYNYCLSAYRSALPLQYGGVYISDIVEKLCVIEGWTHDITPTIWSSYESISDKLVMDGRNALDYIVNVLAPVACSESGYIGYIAKLDKNNHLTFKPAIPDRYNTTDIVMGYNIPDSPLISFTCKTRGNLIMYGVDAEISSVTTYSNESAVLSTYTKSESFIESKFSGKSKEQGSNWFSKGLFSYYGFANTLTGYNSFFKTLYNNGSDFSYGSHILGSSEKSDSDTVGKIVNASLSNSLIRSTPYSSIQGSDQPGELLSDLAKFERSVIEAEITILGDNRIVPNSYINVINMTVRGRHYTSGIYHIQKITDTFSKGTWTQKLTCARYNSNNIYFAGEQTPVQKIDQGVQDLISSVIKNGVTAEQVDKLIQDYLKNNGA